MKPRAAYCSEYRNNSPNAKYLNAMLVSNRPLLARLLSHFVKKKKKKKNINETDIVNGWIDFKCCAVCRGRNCKNCFTSFMTTVRVNHSVRLWCCSIVTLDVTVNFTAKIRVLCTFQNKQHMPIKWSLFLDLTQLTVHWQLFPKARKNVGKAFK